jgi:rod shape-determining protein MreB
VYLLDVPIAAAMGTGMRLSGPNGHLVIDVGAGKTEVAVLALEGTIAGRCLSGHGGERLVAAVTEHVRRERGIALSPPVVEDIVASLARVGPHEERRLEVEGRRGDREQTASITSTELAGCLEDHVRPIASALDEVLSDTPAALRDDVARDGGVLCGGGGRLEGLDRSLSVAAGFDVRTDGEPQLCTIRGTGYALDNLDVLKRTFMYIR